ncbi:MAG: YggT family protein [Zoogloeaceae bacterium]|jgi:YggT family protein|nr:YggT family protein [Zoogloeaceae bacterium]
MQAIYFLLKTISDLFCLLFILRLLMQWRRISFANPFGGFILKLTNWAVLPLRRVIPGFGGVDWASLIVALAVQFVFALAIFGLMGAAPAGTGLLGAIWVSLLLVALFNLLHLVIYLFIIALIVQAVLSWVHPWSPLAPTLRQLTYPLLAPVQKLIPPISGIDLSPLVVILVLQALLMLLPQ